jgi:hypothetical protein
MSTETGRIVNRGMGGFLNPPGHPERSFSVETDLQGRPENRGGLSLSSAIECEWLSLETRSAAARVLKEWSRPWIGAEDVQAWILQVLGYFKNCYQSPSGSWNASDLFIGDGDGHEDQHAGVHLIRKYYPEFVPTTAQFLAARWGK